MISKKKQDFENVKKTVQAHGTLSEEETIKIAEKPEEVSKELLEEGRPSVADLEKEKLAEKGIEEELEERIKEKKEADRVRDGITLGLYPKS